MSLVNLVSSDLRFSVPKRVILFNISGCESCFADYCVISSSFWILAFCYFLSSLFLLLFPSEPETRTLSVRALLRREAFDISFNIFSFFCYSIIFMRFKHTYAGDGLGERLSKISLAYLIKLALCYVGKFNKPYSS